MPIWEEKWDDFSKKEIRDSVAQDEQLNAVCQQFVDYINSHMKEVSELVQSSEGEKDSPWRSTETYSLDLEVDGHNLSWEITYSMDQDGGEDDPEGEFFIDGKNMEYVSWRDCPALGKLDELITQLIPY